MADVSQPLVYLILGAAGSGRREVLADILADGPGPDDATVVLLSAGESPVPADEALGKVVRWHWRGGETGFELPAAALAGATQVFFVTDGRLSPIDQIEAFKAWLDRSGGVLARVFTVVHCRLTEQNPPLIAWHQACIHFSDVVLLNRREEVANKWMSDFQGLFRARFYPCLIELVKAGRVKNPALLLEPEARRMSHLFDEPEWLVDGADAEEVIETGEDDAEEGTVLEEEVEVTQAVDPYLERRAGGRRVIEIPDIGKYLPTTP